MMHGWWLVLAIAGTGCSFHGKARTVSPADVGNPDATRIFNYMSARDGEEETRVDSLIDEATIASMGPGETCFELTVRSTLEVDLHPSQWEIELNGQAGAATEVAPRSSESWTSTVTRQEVVRERTTPRGTTTVTAPVEREVVNGYTVRHVRACAPTPARAGTLELRVVLPQTAGAANWGQRYAWHLRHP